MQDAAQTVDQVLAVLGERFGATGSHLWEVMVRQAYADFAVWVALMLFTAVVAAVFARLFRKMPSETYEQNEAREIVGTIGIVVLAAMTIVSTIGVFATMAGAINPEYHALQTVLDALP